MECPDALCFHCKPRVQRHSKHISDRSINFEYTGRVNDVLFLFNDYSAVIFDKSINHIYLLNY